MMKTLTFRGKFRGNVLVDELLDVFLEWVTGTTMEDRVYALIAAHDPLGLSKSEKAESAKLLEA